MSSPFKKIVNFKAKLVSDSLTYPGIIENISKNGLYVRTVIKNHASDIFPGKTIQVNFESDAGEEICLFCKVKWSYKTPPYGITESMGIEILNSVSNFEKFFNTLS